MLRVLASLFVAAIAVSPFVVAAFDFYTGLAMVIVEMVFAMFVGAAIAVHGALTFRPDTPEDDAHSFADGDAPAIPNGFHAEGDTL